MLDNEQVKILKQEANEKIQKSVESYEKHLLSVRTGRASTNLLDSIKVDYYGSMNSIEQLATITVPEPRMILITVWDKSSVFAIETAIRSSNLGINPLVDGTKIKLPIPPLNEERRKELVKKSSEYVEMAKVAVRNIRHHFLNELKSLQKNKEISEDECKIETDHFEKNIKAINEKIDDIFSKKSKEIMSI
jgi:ribosome recycling factor